ncbi:hypothetical protein VCV18_011547 [Metarhizium anisopliae]
MVASVVSGLEQYPKDRNATVGEVKFSNLDVINLTGPSAWTDVVSGQLRSYRPSLTYRSLSSLAAPSLIGDILVLAIDGLGMGHAGSAYR